MRTLNMLSLVVVLFAACERKNHQSLPTCIGVDLGSAVGQRLATGQVGRASGNNGDTGYWDSGSWDSGLWFADPDDVPLANHAWTAPRDGRYVVDTKGSDFDTMLIARVGGCDGLILTWNDDWIDLESRIGLEMEKDQAIVLQVMGFDREGGTYVLNIREEN